MPAGSRRHRWLDREPRAAIEARRRGRALGTQHQKRAATNCQLARLLHRRGHAQHGHRKLGQLAAANRAASRDHHAERLAAGRRFEQRNVEGLPTVDGLEFPATNVAARDLFHQIAGRYVQAETGPGPAAKGQLQLGQQPQAALLHVEHLLAGDRQALIDRRRAALRRHSICTVPSAARAVSIGWPSRCVSTVPRSGPPRNTTSVLAWATSNRNAVAAAAGNCPSTTCQLPCRCTRVRSTQLEPPASGAGQDDHERLAIGSRVLGGVAASPSAGWGRAACSPRAEKVALASALPLARAARSGPVDQHLEIDVSCDGQRLPAVEGGLILPAQSTYSAAGSGRCSRRPRAGSESISRYLS